MRKGSYFINIFLLVFYSNLSGQSLNLIFKDSLIIEPQEIYLDPLNQIYILEKGKQNIVKLNEDYSINQKISSPFISSYAFMDVKDPMKILLFLPQYSNVTLYDESLAPLSDEYLVGFTNESAICFYSTQQLCYFSEGKLNLKNIINHEVLSSEPIFYDRKEINDVSQLKSDGQSCYLLLPGYGLWKFNSFLNLEYFIEDHSFERMELYRNNLFVLRNSKISMLNSNSLNDKSIIDFNRGPIHTFAMNNKYLIIASSGTIYRYFISE